jgi:hypothetical protein
MSNGWIIVEHKLEGNVAESDMAIVCFDELRIITMTFCYEIGLN